MDLTHGHSHHHSRKSSSQLNTQKDDPTVKFINSLSKYGIIDYNWRKIITEENMKKLKRKAIKMYLKSFKNKDTLKTNLLMDILLKQLSYQEDVLSRVIRQTTGSDPNLTKEKITEDSQVILNELSKNSFSMSNASRQEIEYVQNNHDPNFQEVLAQLTKLCKREKMLVTIYNKRIIEIEEEKDEAEQNLVEFMHKSSIPLLNNS